MCCEDIKIGRKISIGMRSVALTNGGTTPIAPASPDRVYLAFSAPAGNIMVGTDDFVPTTTNGLLIAANMLATQLDIRVAGQSVTGQWLGISVAAAGTIVVIEGFLSPELCRN